ncbi:uncharacterized protein LOC124336399 isoform X2 [Daphnia pulicaria]|uniref:uncharacterized protein LOC124336399 isoform X2 n=1 Tax=Daphnia pulicaria TaxID=35523 RepID=UPI001EECE094|nr:uncharacterized protein LOC124336399 isoform X2 [Daphnia pulicaria]
MSFTLEGHGDHSVKQIMQWCRGWVRTGRDEKEKGKAIEISRVSISDTATTAAHYLSVGTNCLTSSHYQFAITTCAAPACYTEAPNFYNTQVPKYYTTCYGALSCSKSFKRRDKVVEISRVRISDTATTVVHYVTYCILRPVTHSQSRQVQLPQGSSWMVNEEGKIVLNARREIGVSRMSISDTATTAAKQRTVTNCIPHPVTNSQSWCRAGVGCCIVDGWVDHWCTDVFLLWRILNRTATALLHNNNLRNDQLLHRGHQVLHH